MRIKTTADIVNKINWFTLNFSERLVLKTMIDMSFHTRVIPRKQVYKARPSMKISKYALAIHLCSLVKKGFLERHEMLGCGGYIHYEVIAFHEMVPCV